MFFLWFELCFQASFFVAESIHFWSQIMVSLNNSSFEIFFYRSHLFFATVSTHKKLFDVLTRVWVFWLEKLFWRMSSVYYHCGLVSGFVGHEIQIMICFMLEQVQAAIMCTSSKIQHILRWPEINSAIACRAKWYNENKKLRTRIYSRDVRKRPARKRSARHQGFRTESRAVPCPCCK